MYSPHITCIAVDDEPHALSIIENFAQKIDFIDLVRTFRDPLEAISFLHQNKVQLIFLDINMHWKAMNMKPLITYLSLLLFPGF